MAEDLFAESNTAKAEAAYSAKDIEVLEGLEPVRRRPGMYVGGTDDTAMHHLVSEIFDNSMDEAVAGHATRIEVELQPNNIVLIRDNGRGIPVDPHPRDPSKSAVEVILTTLHSGGKFSSDVYQTSGGLHGVGISVVNALSHDMVVEVVRNKELFRQTYSRGHATSKLEKVGPMPNRRGTTVMFSPDPEIFGEHRKFKPKRLYKFVRSKAYLYKGVEIRWSCDPSLLDEKDETPAQETIHFPNGLSDFLASSLEGCRTVTPEAFTGNADLAENMGRVEWAINWPFGAEPFSNSFCNTVPTPLGGTHENAFRAVLYKGLRDYGEMVDNKKAKQVTGEDMLGGACMILSLFYKEPEFQGQTKDKLVSNGATRLVENAIRDHFDHWLTSNPDAANALLAYAIDRAEERLKRRANSKDVSRKNIVHKLRLPGKLADCTQELADGTEIFLVEGDSAGGSAKQARDRKTQAILPLRGKILNVASATRDKIRANQEIKDLQLALGCGIGDEYDESRLRYEKVVIMTDADVDGAHIASLLMTFFYQEMPQLITNGHLYLAQPPLYRITQGGKAYYAADEIELEELTKELEKNRKKLEVGRFKGLGEMTPSQLKETTMDREKRILLRVDISEETKQDAKDRVNELMGKNPELRFRFIQERSALGDEKLASALDI